MGNFAFPINWRNVLPVTNFTNTDRATASAFATLINAGQVTTVGGRDVWSRFGGQAAQVWQNGSVSVNVRGRTARAQGTVWVRVGQSVSTTELKA